MNQRDLLVIGGGPAGTATAIVAARAGKVTLFEKGPRSATRCAATASPHGR
ncbi:MAG: FAD-dependent oxidoreductase [Ilumatobacteraceae bacterium]